MPSFLEPEIRAERGKVTQGIPGLSPAHRATRTYRERQREKSRQLADGSERAEAELTAPDGKRPTTEYEAQKGMELPSSVVIKRLLKLNPNLYFEPAKANQSLMGIYYLDALALEGRRYICTGGYHDRPMPEFTVNQKDKTGRYRPIIGWRYVLNRLIRARYINRHRAEVLFGTPNRDSALWQQLTT